MKIVDAHHHLWDLSANYHPWLCDEPLIAGRQGRGQFQVGRIIALGGKHDRVFTRVGEYVELV